MGDWRDLASCQVELPNKHTLTDDEYQQRYEAAVGDTSFIRKPDEVTERRWARICARCPVIEKCHQWAEETKAAGVFAAGQWREDEGIGDSS